MARFPGVKVTLGDRDFIVPALRFGAVKQFSKDGTFKLIDEMKDVGFTEATIDAAIRVVLTALRVNYPELTEADLLDLMDLRSLPALLGAVTGQSRMEATDPKA